MATFRTTIILDIDVPDGVDPDVFHDDLRDVLEEDEQIAALMTARLDEASDDNPVTIETVREIDVTELDD